MAKNVCLNDNQRLPVENTSSATFGILGMHVFTRRDTVYLFWRKGTARPLNILLENLLENDQCLLLSLLLGNK